VLIEGWAGPSGNDCCGVLSCVGVMGEGAVLTERPASIPAWADATPQQRQLFAHMMEVLRGRWPRRVQTKSDLVLHTKAVAMFNRWACASRWAAQAVSCRVRAPSHDGGTTMRADG
jgi:hypothetical protein